MGLGILIVLAIFKDRKLTSWTPDNQVLKKVIEFPLAMSPKAACQFHCLGIEEDSLRSMLSRSQVGMKMDESSKRRRGIYQLELTEGQIQGAEVELLDDTCRILHLALVSPCQCP